MSQNNPSLNRSVSLKCNTIENNGMSNIPQVKNINNVKLKSSKSIHIVPVTNKIMCLSLHNKHNNNDNKNNRNNNNNNNNNNELNDTKNDDNKLDNLSNSNFGISSEKEKDKIIGNCMPCSITNGNITLTSKLQLIKNERLDGSSVVSSNNNNNENYSNEQSNKQ